jgi:DNA (cytosine-5)-methyltransferase 1
MRKTAQFNFVDLFCGAGGLSTGLEKAGMNCILGTDQEKSELNF